MTQRPAMPRSRAYPPEVQIQYVVSKLTANLLDGLAQSPDDLRTLARAWWPEVDEFDLRQLVPALVEGLGKMAIVVQNRETRLLDEGKLEAPPASRR